MTALVIPTSSAPGSNPQESAGRLVNVFAEKTDLGSPNKVVWKRAPGLREIVDVLGHHGFRGGLYVNSTLVAVFGSRAYGIAHGTGTYSATNLGAFTGTGRLTVARNNAATPDIVAVDPAIGCKNLFTNSGPSNFADADLPQPNSVSQLDGYFIWTIGDGRIFASGLNAVTVATNAYTTAQRRPGGLLRGVAYRGEFFAFGPNGCEVYRDAATAPFPLEFTTLIPRGIVGTNAVAGWEEGWSNELFWVGDDNIVYKLDGYSPTRVSNHSVERAIEGSASRSTIYCDVAMHAGHAFMIVSSTDEFTWVYDLTTGEWHERNSFGMAAFRGTACVRAFDKWIMGEGDSGKLAEFTGDIQSELDNPLVCEIETGVPPTFPSRGVVSKADFDFTVGVGSAIGNDPVQTDPVVQLWRSLDGGRTWGNPVTRRLGAQGSYYRRVTWQRVGRFHTQGIRFRIRVSDPVHVALRGIDVTLA